MADDNKHLKLAERGHELLQQMKQAPTAGPNHQSTWDKLKADVVAWEEECRKTLPGNQRARFNSTFGRETDWPTYADLIHNPHKQLAANIAARTALLSQLE